MCIYSLVGIRLYPAYSFIPHGYLVIMVGIYKLGPMCVRILEIHTINRRGRESDFYFVMSILIKIYSGRTRTKQQAAARRHRSSLSPSFKISYTRHFTLLEQWGACYILYRTAYSVLQKRIIIYCIYANANRQSLSGESQDRKVSIIYF